MMNTIYEKNLACMEKSMPELHKACCLAEEKYLENQKNENSPYIVDESVKGEKIIGIYKDQDVRFLNSRYDAQKAADIWAAQYDNIHYKSIILLCGIANGAYLSKLQNITGQENKIIVYEPDQMIFLTVLHHMDLTEQLSDERVAIFVDQLNSQSIRQYFHEIYECELVELSMTMISPVYSYLYAEQIANLITECQKEIRFMYGTNHTIEHYGEEICDNIIRNIWRLFQGISINDFKMYLSEKNIDVSRCPVIIVAAGPSLQKNIEDLKKARGKAFIVAVDTAINKMLQHDLIPDLLITVDSHKPMNLFFQERTKEIPIAVCGQSRHEVLTTHRGRKIVFSGDMFLLKMFAHLGKKVQGLQTGGSVANDAFSFVEFLGFENIIMIGQDLAFTNNKKHVDNTYKEKAIGEDDADEYTYVEDYEGNPILTYTNFRVYKEWFENRIKDHPELNVVNATEGGAKIHGAKHITLKEAIETYCTETVDLDIEHARSIFNDKELELAYHYLKNLVDRCTELHTRFEHGIELYHKLEDLIANGIINGPEYDDINSEIQDVSTLDQREPIMELLTMYARKEENEILNSLYKEEEGLDGARIVIGHGMDILRVYQKKLAHIKKMLDMLFRYEVNEDLFEIHTYCI